MSSHDATHGGHQGDPDADLKLKSILWTTVGIVLIAVVAAILMWWMGVGMRSNLVEADRKATPWEERRKAAATAANAEHARPAPLPGLVLPENAEIPPGPNLELAEGYELGILRAHETEILENYGWTDEANGLVRIPIDRALELAAEGLLPSAAPAPAVPADEALADAEDGDA